MTQEYLLAGIVLIILGCFYLVDKRIEVIHKRIDLICKANHLWGSWDKEDEA